MFYYLKYIFTNTKKQFLEYKHKKYYKNKYTVIQKNPCGYIRQTQFGKWQQYF